MRWMLTCFQSSFHDAPPLENPPFSPRSRLSFSLFPPETTIPFVVDAVILPLSGDHTTHPPLQGFFS